MVEATIVGLVSEGGLTIALSLAKSSAPNAFGVSGRILVLQNGRHLAVPQSRRGRDVDGRLQRRHH